MSPIFLSSNWWDLLTVLLTWRIKFIINTTLKRGVASRHSCGFVHPYWATSTVAIVIVTQPISWYSFYHPTARHCSRGVQPVPKAVYRSGHRDKHNRPRCDSNLGPLTPQSDALTAIATAICRRPNRLPHVVVTVENTYYKSGAWVQTCRSRPIYIGDRSYYRQAGHSQPQSAIYRPQLSLAHLVLNPALFPLNILKYHTGVTGAVKKAF